VFRTIWTTAGSAAGLTLTDRRIVYTLAPTETGAPITPGTLRLDPAGGIVAGQVRHRNTANLLALDGAEYGAPGMFRSVASVIDPPNVAIRVHLFFADRQSACDERWIRAIAAERVARHSALAATAPEKWAVLERQASRPTYADGHYGPAAQLPFTQVLGSDRPRP
jgi:hypothetical protein